MKTLSLCLTIKARKNGMKLNEILKECKGTMLNDELSYIETDRLSRSINMSIRDQGLPQCNDSMWTPFHIHLWFVASMNL